MYRTSKGPSIGRLSRSRGFVPTTLATIVATVFAFFVSMPTAGAVTVDGMDYSFNGIVNGDFITTGNGVLGCAGQSGCPTLNSANAGTGSTLYYNDNFTMTAVDTDGVSGTYNSTSASVTVPNRAKVVSAMLYWMGNTGAITTDGVNWANAFACTTNAGGAASLASGQPTAPANQPVKLNVAGAGYIDVNYSSLAAEYPSQLGLNQPQYYSAQADVTAAFANIPTGSPQQIMVGNVWAPQGKNCSGGWGLTLVYDFGKATYGAPNTYARQVAIYDGHQRQFNGDSPVYAQLQATAVSGGAKASYILMEGDPAIAGDGGMYQPISSSGALGTAYGIPGASGAASTVSGSGSSAAPTGGNVGMSFADGATALPGMSSGQASNGSGATTGTLPTAQSNVAGQYNASIDAHTVALPQVTTGTTGVRLGFNTTGDSYLIKAFAISVPVASFTVTKSATNGTDTQTVNQGDQPQFTITVSNNSAADMTGVTVADTLAPGCAQTTPFTVSPGTPKTYTCTGPNATESYTNTATATGKDGAGQTQNTTDSTQVTVLTPNLDASKSGGTITGPDGSGNYTVTYTVNLTNTGQGYAVVGPLVDTPNFGSNLQVLSTSWTGTGGGATGGSVSGSGPGNLVPAGTKIPAQTTMSWQVTSTFKFTDQNPASTCAGPGTGLYNGVSLQGGSDTVSTNNSACVNPPVRTPQIDAVKRVGSVTGPAADGSYTATYTVTVTNSGLVDGTYGPLTDTPAFSSNLAVDSASWTTSGPGAPTGSSATGAGPYTIGPANTSIAAGATHTYTITEKFHFKDSNVATACNLATPGTGLYNSVSVSGDIKPSNNMACMEPPTPPSATISLDKRASAISDVNNSGKQDAGDTITYSFVVTNTSQVNLDTVQLTDSKLGLSNVACGTGVLAPGASRTCAPVTYTLTQADVTAGGITNNATITGKIPGGSATATGSDSTTSSIVAGPAISLNKNASSVNDLDGNGPDVGDQVTYTFRVTNTGNLNMTSVVINDAKLGILSYSCGAVNVGQTVTCTAPSPYTLTQADVDAGTVTNSATAQGTASDGSKVSSTNSATVTVPASPSILMDKQAGAITDANNNGKVDVGDTIAFNFIVKNTGTVTLNPVTVTDPSLGVSNATCGAGGLAPGATVACPVAQHSITQLDLDSGTYNNNATAQGKSPTGTIVQSTDASSSVISGSSSIALQKAAAAPVDANGNGKIDAGDTITYSFLVTNNGSVSVNNVLISDARLGLNRAACGTGPLAPNTSRSCSTATYTLTQADVDAGAVANTANAYAQPPTGNEIGATSSVAMTVGAPSSIALTKTAGNVVDANGNGVTDPGDTIAYTFSVKNTGSVTLNNVSITDTKISGADIACGSGPLLPGATRDCASTTTYKLTQADIDAGAVNNTARAHAYNASGALIEGVATANRAVTTTPSISLDKQVVASGNAGTTPVTDVNANGRIDVGDKLTYRFVVRNTGNVTLNPVQLVDGKLSQNYSTCSPNALAPGASVTCPDYTYTLTQADIDSGTVDNLATIHGRSPQNVDVTNVDETSTTLPPAVSLTLAKTAAYTDVNGNGVRDAGDTVTYNFTVVNTGNVSLKTVQLTDTKVGLNNATCDAASTGLLAPGQSRDCTPRTYTLTQADIDSGNVHNDATVLGTGNDPAATTATAPSMADVPITAQPALVVDKQDTAPADTNGTNRVDAGDTVTFSFTVTNTGNVSLSSVQLTDAKLGLAGAACLSTETGPLAPGATRTCTVRPYALTAADLDAGTVDNSVTARGTSPKGTVVTGTDSTSRPLTAAPGISLDKQSSALSDPDGNGPDAGDTYTYTFVVTNTGTVSLDPVTITDAKLGVNGVACGGGPLAAGETRTCTISRTYSLTQADANAGKVVNTATAIGTPPTGAQVSGTDSVTNDFSGQVRPATMTVDKQAGAVADANANGKVDAGDTITFTYQVSNTGTTTMTNPTVTDTKLGLGAAACSPATPLEPGVTRECLQKVYTLTQADIDAGTYDNTATAGATDIKGAAVQAPADTTSTPLVQARGLTMKKTAGTVVDANGTGKNDAGDTVTYRFQVTNTGTVTLTGLKVTDSKLGLTSTTCGTGTLAPGASTYCFAGGYTYTVQQADMDAAQIVNNASVTGNPPTGAALTASGTVTTPLVVRSQYTFTKAAGTVVDANGNRAQDAGDTVTYTFTVTNTGTQSLDSVTVTDSMLGMAGTACGTGPLAPGATRTCTSPAYVLTQADLDAGSVTNTATSSATGPDGKTYPGTSSAAVNLTPGTSIALDKVAGAIVDANNNGVQDAGDTIRYTFTVKNTGTVSLNDVRLTDTKLGLANVTCGSGVLPPGATRTCDPVNYTLTVDDANAGVARNSASVAAKNSVGAVFTGTDTADVPVAENASIRFNKTAGAVVDANADGIRGNAGDTITFTFGVTNTGNVALGPITLNEPQTGITVPCGTNAGAPLLQPGATRACGSYVFTIDQGDVDKGTVDNLATAVGTSVRGTTTAPASDRTSTVLDQSSALEVTKTVTTPSDTNGDGVIGAGDTLVYDVTVKNTGQVSLANVTVTDAKVGLANAACGTGSLAPGATRTCSLAAPYTITQADANAGTIRNIAAVNATKPDGSSTNGTGTATATVRPTPALTFDKQATPASVTAVGQQVTYTFTVTNTGNVTLTPVTLTDARLGLSAVPCGGALQPGEVRTCTPVTYTATQADIDAGTIDNTASVTAQPPTGTTLTRTDAVVVDVPGTTGLTLKKTAGSVVDANSTGRDDAGDTITYTFVVTNTGNKTMSTVTVTDAKLGLTNVACGTDPLLPGQTRTCTLGARATYALTAADLNAGVVNNSATAAAKDPTGANVVSPASTASVPLTQTPALTLDKTAGAVMDLDGNGTDAGDTVTYRFTITNSGTVSIAAPTLTDPLARLNNTACGLNPLAPGESRVCSAVVHTLTQAEVDAGTIDNAATAAGKDPSGATVTSPVDTTSTVLTTADKLTMTKKAGVVADTNGTGRQDAGDTITYTFTVTNAGTATLHDVTVTDARLGVDRAACVATLAPGATATCPAQPPYTLTQADIDAGSVANSAMTTGLNPAGNPTSATAAVTVPLQGASTLVFDKQAAPPVDVNGNGLVDAGDTIAYAFSVTNTGATTLTNVSVTDTRLGVGGAVCAAALAPGATATCPSTTYTITQADVNAGTVDNTASTRSTDPYGATITGTDTVSTPIVSRASIALTKQAAPVADANGDGLKAGDPVVYTFTVTNTGTMSMKTVTVTDAKLGLSNVRCGSAQLDPGKSVTCQVVSYATTQADWDAAKVVNTASATGTPVNGAAVSSVATVTTPLPTNATATFDKADGPISDVDGNGVDAGDQIAYSFTVTNTGNVDLEPVTYTDAKLGLAAAACGTTPLAPGETRRCPAKTYTLTQADVDAGTVDNTATVTFTRPDGTTFTAVDATSKPIAPASSVDLVKTGTAVQDANASGRTDAGDTITYTFTVTNTGTTTLTNVAVADPTLFAGAVTCTKPTLAPGEKSVCTTQTYTLTQADVDAGTHTNAASVDALAPGGTHVTDTSAVTTPVTRVSSIALDKQVVALGDTDNNDADDPGDTITYGFVVTNTGTTVMTNVQVTDSRLAATPVACGAEPLAPGASRTCQVTASNTYTVTQADINAGAVNNTANAVATAPDGTTRAATDTTSTQMRQNTGLTLVKTGEWVDANGDGVMNVGDRIDYTLVAHNTGNVTLTNVRKNDPALNINNALCGNGVLAPGETRTCYPADYGTTGRLRYHDLTQADIDAGTYRNDATLTGTKPDGTTVVAPSTYIEPITRASSFTFDKQAGSLIDNDGNGPDAGDTITYTFSVKNTGNTSLNPVTYTDTKLGLAGTACGSTALLPGETRSCPARTYTLTQADVDAGSVANTATVVATDPTGQVLRKADSTSTDVAGTMALAVAKTGSAIVDNDGNGPDAGDTITYAFTVTNSGTESVSNVRLTDAKVGVAGVSCGSGTLAPGQSFTCPSATYTLTQADLDAGRVDNTATATADGPHPGETVNGASNLVHTPIAQTATITLDKAVASLGDTNSNDADDPGDTITYSFTVTNTGNTAMTNVTIRDSRLAPTAVACGSDALLPGESRTCQVTATNTYTLTQADVDAGAVNNTAAVSATGFDGLPRSATDTTSTPMRQNNGLTLVKTGEWVDVTGDGVMNVGDRIDYTLVAHNTGNTTLTDVRKSDPAININNALCGNGTLAPGETRTCYPADYGTTGRLRYHDLTQADIDAGTYRNDATLTGTKPDGTKIVAPSTFIEPITRSSSFTFDKQAGSLIDVDGNGPDAGDTITYTFSVTNTGNTSLNPVTYTDAKLGIANAACGGTALLPGETRSCPAKTYTLTQADVDAAAVANTATVVATDPTGQVLRKADSTSTDVNGALNLAIVKTAGAVVDRNADGVVDAGDVVTYSFTVTNNGTKSLHGVTYSDAKLGITDAVCSSATLAPQQSVTCPAKTYTLTQADIDAGRVDNTASAAAQGPRPGEQVTAGSGLVTKPLAQQPAVTLDKQAGALVDVDGNGPDAGDTITYTFVVRNTGNVTLTPVSVTDTKLGVTADCGTLAPGEQRTCTSSTYTLTQADANTGTVDNVASVTAQPPLGNPITGTDRTSTPVAATASIALVKTAATPVDTNGNGLVDAGDTVAYTFSVRNTGTVSLTNVAVSDAKVGLVAAACGSGTAPLQPGETRAGCITKTYVLKQADIDAGTVLNTATATATPPSGADVSSPASVTVPVAETPAVELDKHAGSVVDANNDGALGAGDTVLYTFVVTNTGNVTLNNITYTDPVAGLNAAACGTTSLAPGESRSCASRTITLTQAMVDAGTLDNSATARAQSPAGTFVTGADTTSTPLLAGPAITLKKAAGAITDANGSGRTDAGDTVAYTFTVRNTGNVTLKPVTYTDPILGITDAACVASLAPGTTATCPARTYTLTQADVDALQVRNTATATGTAPDGTTQQASSTNLLPVTEVATVALDKTAGTVVDVNGNGRRDAGDTIEYTLTVANTGTATLTGVTVTDAKLGLTGLSCGADTLAPGASRECATRTYTLTQADVDAGSVDNSATAVGADTHGHGTAPAADTTSTPLTVIPQIALTKTASTPVDVNGNGLVDAGDTVTYSFTVQNVGSVTMTGVTLTDTRLGISKVACGTGPLAPGATRACADASYTLTQADVNAGPIVNNAVATATPPSGPAVTSSSSVTVTPAVVKSMEFTKTASTVNDTDGNGPDVNDTVVYTLTVKNTGTVSLNPVTITDPRLRMTNQACGTTALAPGQTRVCSTPTYALTQADVDAGVVVNTATATGTAPDGSKVAQTASATVETPGTSMISLDKQASTIADSDNNGMYDIGDTITYTFLVTNTGTTTLSSVTLTDTKLGLVDAACGTGPLAPHATRTCTAVAYHLTQADVDAGTVDNSAAVAAKNPAGTAVDGTDGTSTPVPETPRLVLTKTAGAIVDANGDGQENVGDTITYTFVVRNTGSVDLDPVTYVDPMFSPNPVACGTTALAPGETRTCGTQTHALTLADLNANGVTNTATAAGTSPAGTVVTSVSSTSTPIDAVRSISMDKTSEPVVDANGDGVVGNAGDTIAYRFVVKNTGNLTLHQVTYTDSRLGIIDAACGADPLDPGQTRTCPQLTYTLTQADVDTNVTRPDGTRGPAVVNTAVATGLTPRGLKVTGTDTVENVLAPRSSIVLDKQVGALFDADGSGGPSAGDTLRYTFRVTNTGDVTANDLALTDAMLGLHTAACSDQPLAPGQSVDCHPVTYRLTQADINDGVVDNDASIAATDALGKALAATDATSSPITQAPGIALTKAFGGIKDNGDGLVGPGDAVTYTFHVVNTGNVTLDPVTITDAKVGLTNAACGGPLAPGEARDCPAATYVRTAADVAAGQVVNTATASGTYGAGRTTTSQSSVTIPARATVELDKTAGALQDIDGNGPDAGDQVTYSFTVKNTGLATLSAVSMTDAKLGLANVPCNPMPLAPGASATCPDKTYTLTQADVDAGTVRNTAAAQGVSQTTGLKTPVSTDQTVTDVTRTSTLVLDKSASVVADVNANGRKDAGDRVTYTFVVTNTGNQTLTAVTLSDPTLGVTAACGAGALAPGASRACTPVQHTVTQIEVDAGGIENVATATGTDPMGAKVPGTDSTSTSLEEGPGIALTKSASAIADTTGDGMQGVGDTITYTFTVTNTGTVTLSGVALNDAMVGMDRVTCGTASLAPGASTTCTKAYVLTQADADAGTVRNTATVVGSSPTGTTVTAAASATAAVTATRAIALTKTADAPVDANADGVVGDAGDTVTYHFVVRNTGNVSLADVTVTDTRLGRVGVACPDPADPTKALAPGASRTCATATYTLTQGDVDQQVTRPDGTTGPAVVNTARATGTTPDGAQVNGTSTATTKLTPSTGLVLDKASSGVVDGDGNGPDAGDTITFRFTVTNTGTYSLSPVTITDAKAGLANAACGIDPLAPGETRVCPSKTVVLTLADIDAGAFDNVATATGTNPAGVKTTSTDSTTDDASGTVSVRLVKTGSTPTDTNGDGLVGAGDTVTYTFVVTNTGTTSVHGVTITDDKLAMANVACGAATAALAPGQSRTCPTRPYVLTQADVDAGAVENTATVAAVGNDPAATKVTDDSSATKQVPAAPAIHLDKTAGELKDTNGNGIVGDAGHAALTSPVAVPEVPADEITYTFVVTNTGNVTLNLVRLTDDHVGAEGVTCQKPVLAPGEKATCSYQGSIKQGDVDVQMLVNTADVVGTAPDGAQVTDRDSVTTKIAAKAAMTLDKSHAGATSADPTAVRTVDTNNSGTLDAGDTLQYTFRVTNTGSATLTDVTVNDARIGVMGAACGTDPLLPGESRDCSTPPYTVTQDDLNTGVIDNTATVTATAPTGVAAPDAATDTDSAVVAGQPGLQVTKTATAQDTNTDGHLSPGESIQYEFSVKNTGNVPLRDVTLTDPMLGMDAVACQVNYDTGETIAFTLMPGQSHPCSGYTMVLTEADVLDLARTPGHVVHNTVTAGATSDAGPVVSAEAFADTVLTPVADLRILKSAGDVEDTNGNGIVDPGDTVAYTIKLWNAGNLDVLEPTVSDPMLFGDTPAACLKGGAVTTLAPAEVRTCGFTQPDGTVATSYQHVLTEADILAGAVNNTAHAQGALPEGLLDVEPTVTSDESSTSTPLTPVAGIALDKKASGVQDANNNGRQDPGDTITYTFSVTNTGSVGLTDVAVTDPTAGHPDTAPLACPDATDPAAPLAPHATRVCPTVVHTLTADDFVAGALENTATVTGTPPAGTNLAPPTGSDTVSSDLVGTPRIELDKQAGTVVDVDRSGTKNAGDTIVYTFTVTNSGALPLANVTVEDPFLGLTGASALACGSGPLAVGESRTCTAPAYTLTLGDQAAGALDNYATASGTATAADGTTSTVRAHDATSTPITKVTSVTRPTVPSAPGTPGTMPGTTPGVAPGVTPGRVPGVIGLPGGVVYRNGGLPQLPPGYRWVGVPSGVHGGPTYVIGPDGRLHAIDPATGRELAYTGAQVWSTLAAGLALVAGGLLLVVAASRRRRRDNEA